MVGEGRTVLERLLTMCFSGGFLDFLVVRPSWAVCRVGEAALLEMAGGQRQHNLYGDILPSANCTSDVRMVDTNLNRVQVQGMGTLPLFFVDPLPAGDDSDAPLFIDI